MKDLRSTCEPNLHDLPPSYDRRRRERVELAIPLRIFSCGLLAAKSNLGTCTGLSEGGVSFDCDADLNVGDIVVLEFHQKGEAAYRCHARVAYRIENRYGAYFLTGE